MGSRRIRGGFWGTLLVIFMGASIGAVLLLYQPLTPAAPDTTPSRYVVAENDGAEDVMDQEVEIEPTQSAKQQSDSQSNRTSQPHVLIASSTVEGTTNSIQSANQKLDPQYHNTQQIPYFVKQLCSIQGEVTFVTQEGQQHTFRKRAATAKRCDEGNIWKVTEDGAKVPDAATFYFDGNGILLDICQGLFWRSGCTRFENISCEQSNSCEERYIGGN